MICRVAASREREAAAVKLRSAELLRLGFVMALAMTLHNMPEGFAVRVNHLPWGSGAEGKLIILHGALGHACPCTNITLPGAM